LIGPQALVRRTETAEANAGPFVSRINEDDALVLKSNPDGRQGGLGGATLAIQLSMLDGWHGQARAPGKLGLGQADERPSGPQLSGGNHSLVHQGHASMGDGIKPA
jgi:hypothetical protein